MRSNDRRARRRLPCCSTIAAMAVGLVAAAPALKRRTPCSLQSAGTAGGR